METGPFTIKIDPGVSKIQTENGWEAPFIVISKVGNTEVYADSGAPVKANANETITLLVTIPDAYTVTGFKVNGSISPQKISEDETPAIYSFKMPSATVTIKGTLTPKTPEALIDIEGVFDNTLQGLYIAQGKLVPVEGNTASRINIVRDTAGGEDNPDDPSTEEPEIDPFTPEIQAYIAEVPFSGYPAVITAIPNETEAGVEITVPEPQFGQNKYIITIKVTSPFWNLCDAAYKPEEGVEFPAEAEPKDRTYTITVTRGAGDASADVDSITMTETSLTNKDGVYAGTVAANVEKLHLNAVAEHSNARIQIKPSGSSLSPALADAKNSILQELAAPAEESAGETIVKVTAEDGSTEKEYKVQIYREKTDPGALPNNASGGSVKRETIGGTLYEIHTFTVESGTDLGKQASHTLNFTKKPADGKVEVLVVAGGGGGGANGDQARGGGGGAGGFIYHPAYALGEKTSFDVKVGAGGAKADAQISGGIPNFAINTRGGTGGDSVFGNDFTAYGGGGGGNLRKGHEGAGGSGGSGGGGAYKIGGAVTSGKAPAGAVNLGNKGGGSDVKAYSAAGGGGAVERGADVSLEHTGGSGGAGTQSAISGALVWYAGGGAGGAEDAYNKGAQYGAKSGNDGDANTGDGGSGSGGASKNGVYIIVGGNGGSGVVIVRWPFNTTK
ncbi:MAG: cadherin-like beta sandwich domain-containing protein [Spirochaetaceae bacterium]|nr:cadherin-like beta sandwich domain-containing protein [Spirochaetaceae bacterium]